MAGGSLTITVNTYGQLFAAAQRVLCDIAAADRVKVLTVTGANGQLALRIPEEIFSGALTLKNGGSDILSGYVAGTHITYNVPNFGTSWLSPAITPLSACVGDVQRVQVNSVATNVGSNPLAVTINYANFATNGTVNVYWGDGTSTLGAAESNSALAHTYPNVGAWMIKIEDASAPADSTTAQSWINIP
jgi:hypothetical protein